MMMMMMITTPPPPKCLFDSLQILDLSKNVYINMQKEVIVGTCHPTRKFMSQ
jgi:hypothetical protein